MTDPPPTAEPREDPNAEESTASPAAFRLSATALEDLRSILLQKDGRERVAFGACTVSGDTLLLHRLFAVPDTGHAQSTPKKCRPTNEVEREYISHITTHERHPFIVHSHPQGDMVQFSPADDTMIASYRNWLRPLFPDRHLIFGVITDTAMRCHILPAAGSPDESGTAITERTRLPVTVVGDWRLSAPVQTAVEDQSTMDVSWHRFDRSIRALGLSGQAALQDAHVAVVGVGGVGSHVAVDLARLGIGELTLVDPDDVERSNLPRLRYAQSGDCGHPKVQVIQRACTRATPNVDTTTVYARAQDAATSLQQADIIVGCVDRVTARYFLNEFAVRHLIPYLDVGVRIEVVDGSQRIEAETAFLQTVAPGVTACFDCRDRGDPEQARIEQADEATLQEDLERGYISGADLNPAPAVIDLNGEAASKAVRLVKQIVTGVQAPPSLLQYDATTQEITTIQTTPSTACPTCGEYGVLAAGDHEFGPDAHIDDSGDSAPGETAGLEAEDSAEAATAFPTSVAQCFQQWWPTTGHRSS